MATLIQLLAAGVMLALAIVDIRERRIPRSGQLALLLLAVVDVALITGGPGVEEAILGALMAGVVGYLVYAGGRLYGKWRAVYGVVFGMGDVRVLLLMGALLGVEAVPSLLWRSALLGGLLALAYLLSRLMRGQAIHRDLSIPYIPPIALAAGSVMFGVG